MVLSFIMPDLNWLAFYDWVRSVFEFPYSRDLEAALILSSILRGRSGDPNLIGDMIQGREVIVVGAGPDLDKQILASLSLLKKSIVIAADGATSALLKMGIKPNIIVSDLDGNVQDQVVASRVGAIPVIHAHGDNIDALKKWVELFKEPIIGTCQVPPPPNLHVFGGFTDGDRGVVIALHFGAKRVRLLGWSFGDLVGKYSKPWYKKDVQASRIKRIKMVIAEYIVRQMIEIYPGKIFLD